MFYPKHSATSCHAIVSPTLTLKMWHVCTEKYLDLPLKVFFILLHIPKSRKGRRGNFLFCAFYMDHDDNLDDGHHEDESRSAPPAEAG